MARIAGVDLPENKRVPIALTYIYGIGVNTANKIVKDLKIDPSLRMKQLDEGSVENIRKYIEDNLKIEGELRQIVFRNIKRLKDIRTYRGIMHRRGLPVRGQRTKHNARTRKGKSQPIGGLKKVLSK